MKLLNLSRQMNSLFYLGSKGFHRKSRLTRLICKVKQVGLKGLNGFSLH